MDKALNSVISSCSTGNKASLITFASSDGRMGLWAGLRREAQGKRLMRGVIEGRGKVKPHTVDLVSPSSNPSPRDIQPRLMEAMKRAVECAFMPKR